MKWEKKAKETYNYGLIFDYKRNIKEIHYWLISNKVIKFSTFKKNLGKKTNLYTGQNSKNQVSMDKIKTGQNILKPLFSIPFINFIGITGSVSAKNAKIGDDIDVFIITRKNTLWLTRPLVLLFLELRGYRRSRKTSKKKQQDLICTNLWMDDSNLKLPTEKQSLYTAHEVLQVFPVYDRDDTYHRFILENIWTKKYLANAYHYKLGSINMKKNKNQLHWFISKLINPINYLLYVIQLFIMFPKTKGEHVFYHQAYFHNHQYSTKILQKHKKLNFKHI